MLTFLSTTNARTIRRQAARRSVSVAQAWRNMASAGIAASKRFVSTNRFGGCFNVSFHTEMSSDYRSICNSEESPRSALAVRALPATAALHM